MITFDHGFRIYLDLTNGSLIGSNVLLHMSTLRMIANTNVFSLFLTVPPGYPSRVNQNKDIKAIRVKRQTKGGQTSWLNICLL